MTRIAIIRDRSQGERRSAITPEAVKKYIALGAEVAVETGTGEAAAMSDESLAAAGALVAPLKTVLDGADLILTVQAPDAAALAGAPGGATVIGLFNPYHSRAAVQAYAEAGLRALAMEFIPRITRAQSMDVMSSQANLAGYKAVLDGAAEYVRAFPMMMTAAGTIAAARVFVMGVGVAGLQAIATARRLGASVSATDVRAAVKEQIESLGAKAIFVEGETQDDSGTGGYAVEMSDAGKLRQAELVSSHLSKQDVVITTALIPGRPAPRLISDAQLATMRPGSVVVDLAVEQGGNVEGSVAGEVVERHGVRIVGHRNVPSRLASDASALYARNIYNFVAASWAKEAKAPAWKDDDEIIRAVTLTRDHAVVHPALVA